MSAHPARLRAQYLNTDGGRPGRIEDATPTPRRALDIDFPGLQFERLRGGVSRFRIDPGLAYGVLPRSEISVRFPLVELRYPASSSQAGSSGLAGMALGAMYAFTLETPDMPALAMAGEALLPIGALAAPRPSYLVKVLATKQLGPVRLHVNGGAGAYSVNLIAPALADSNCDAPPATRFGAQFPGSCGSPPIIVDQPCSRFPSSMVAPLDGGVPPSVTLMTARFARMCMPSAAPASAAAPSQALYGARWFTGVGIDHAFALRSMLISADIVAERFVGLYPSVDGIAEAGIRYQVSPIALLEAGVNWKFAGTIRSASIMLGSTFEFAMPLFHRSPRN